MKGYLAHYAPDFELPGGESRAAWEKQREERISRPKSIDVQAKVLSTQVNGSEATVKITLNGTAEHRVAEGDGPIAALDGALRKALLAHFPAIEGVHLIDYKVRVINSKDETSAAVRVVIECRRDRGDGTKEIFGTIGVSENIIEASWQALVDAYEYHLVHVEEAASGRA